MIDNFKTYSSLRISSINILNTTYIFYSILQTFNHDNIQGFFLNGNLNNILSSTYINMIKLGNRHATYLSPVTISYDTASNNDIKCISQTPGHYWYNFIIKELHSRPLMIQFNIISLSVTSTNDIRGKRKISTSLTIIDIIVTAVLHLKMNFNH